MKHRPKISIRVLEACVYALSATVLVWLLATLPSLAWSSLFLFVALVLWAGNSWVIMPNTSVSPVFMVVMTSITSMGIDQSPHGPALIALAGGIQFDYLRNRRFAPVAYNSCTFFLCTTVAAQLYRLGSEWEIWSIALVLAATSAWAVVNGILVLPAVVIDTGESVRKVWADMRPTVPNFLAFGVLGMLIGQFYVSLGPVALALLLIPVAIARSTFQSIIELMEAHDSTIRVFLRAIEAKDKYTHRHTQRVAQYSMYMGERMGLSPDQLEQLRRAALMHDIGKLATPSHLLNKPGKLTEEEFAIVKDHNRICTEILNRVEFLQPMIATATDRYGHFETEGEPDPAHIDSYIVAVADAFDAMTSTRSYRRALPMETAFQELLEKSGSQFHPACVRALIEEIEARGEHFGAGYEDTDVVFDVPPPVVGVGSAGLGDLAPGAPFTRNSREARR